MPGKIILEIDVRFLRDERVTAILGELFRVLGETVGPQFDAVPHQGSKES